MTGISTLKQKKCWWLLMQTQAQAGAIASCILLFAFCFSSSHITLAVTAIQLESGMADGSLQLQSSGPKKTRTIMALLSTFWYMRLLSKWDITLLFKKNLVASLLSFFFGKWPSFQKKIGYPSFLSSTCLVLGLRGLCAVRTHKTLSENGTSV